MFNSTIFDLAFGLVCVFLAVSLLTSALSLRAKTLLSGIKQLLNDQKLPRPQPIPRLHPP
jgi:hypothetical protein